MRWFRCFIRGENFPGALAGTEGLVGFYITRFIEAEDAAEAETRVLCTLRTEPKLAPPPGFVPQGKARVIFEQVTELPGESVPRQPPGFVWYPMDEHA